MDITWQIRRYDCRVLEIHIDYGLKGPIDLTMAVMTILELMERPGVA